MITLQGMEAVARLRCSKGLTVERYLGSFHRRTATDIDLPAINTDQSVAVQLRHEDKLDKEAYLQFVVLYSTSQGERHIRQAFMLWMHIRSLDITLYGDDWTTHVCSLGLDWSSAFYARHSSQGNLGIGKG